MDQTILPAPRAGILTGDDKAALQAGKIAALEAMEAILRDDDSVMAATYKVGGAIEALVTSLVLASGKTGALLIVRIATAEAFKAVDAYSQEEADMKKIRALLGTE